MARAAVSRSRSPEAYRIPLAGRARLAPVWPVFTIRGARERWRGSNVETSDASPAAAGRFRNRRVQRLADRLRRLPGERSPAAMDCRREPDLCARGLCDLATH